MTSRQSPLFLAIVLAAAGATLAGARAAPLDADTCARVKGEHEQLEKAGASQDMAKGPAWAKANLAPVQLEQVRRFIELEQLILFRCRGKSLVDLTPEPESDGAGKAKADKAKADKGKADKGKADRGKADRGKAAPKSDKPKAAAPAARQESQKAKAGRSSHSASRPESRAGTREPARAGVTSVVKTPPKDRADDARAR